MRFWTLPYDLQLTQWLRTVDPSRPSIMAAREFGAYPEKWQFSREELLANGLLEPQDLGWQPDPEARGTISWPDMTVAAWDTIRAEVQELQQLMQDDREVYLDETIVQADNLYEYFISFIGASEARFIRGRSSS